MPGNNSKDMGEVKTEIKDSSDSSDLLYAQFLELVRNHHASDDSCITEEIKNLIDSSSIASNVELRNKMLDHIFTLPLENRLSILKSGMMGIKPEYLEHCIFEKGDLVLLERKKYLPRTYERAIVIEPPYEFFEESDITLRFTDGSRDKQTYELNNPEYKFTPVLDSRMDIVKAILAVNNTEKLLQKLIDSGIINDYSIYSTNHVVWYAAERGLYKAFSVLKYLYSEIDTFQNLHHDLYLCAKNGRYRDCDEVRKMLFRSEYKVKSDCCFPFLRFFRPRPGPAISAPSLPEGMTNELSVSCGCTGINAL